jgi:hypothetical protein
MAFKSQSATLYELHSGNLRRGDIVSNNLHDRWGRLLKKKVNAKNVLSQSFARGTRG